MKKKNYNLNPSQYIYCSWKKNRFKYLNTKVEIREIYKKKKISQQIGNFEKETK